jgi:hypothetical protein
MEARRWVVHVALLWSLRRVEVEDKWVNVMSCIGLFYPNFAIFFVLGHKGNLVISFSIIRTPMAGGKASNSVIPLPPPSHSSFSRGVDVLHGVREEMRDSEISL